MAVVATLVHLMGCAGGCCGTDEMTTSTDESAAEGAGSALAKEGVTIPDRRTEVTGDEVAASRRTTLSSSWGRTEGPCQGSHECGIGAVCADGECQRTSGCRSSADCPGSSSCNPDTGTCASTICLSDADCRVGVCAWGWCRDVYDGCTTASCSPSGYCIGATGECENFYCTSSDDCAAGRFCDGKLCRDCQRDEHCPGDQTCRMPAGQCDEPAQCDGDDDCEGARVCADGQCAEPPCEEDSFYGNNNSDSAAPLQPGEYDLTFCGETSSDWFAIELSQGEGLLVHVGYDKDRGGIEVRPYLPGARQELARFLDSSGSGTVTGALEHAQETGTWRLRVKRNWGGNMRYRLRVMRQPTGICTDDDAEPDDKSEQAHKVANGLRVFRACPGDDDWHMLPAETDKVRITVVEGPGVAVDAFASPTDDDPIVEYALAKNHTVARSPELDGKPLWLRVRGFADIGRYHVATHPKQPGGR